MASAFGTGSYAAAGRFGVAASGGGVSTTEVSATVRSAIGDLLGTAPESLDTLGEISAALLENADFGTYVQDS
jgi:hypothetical protein